MKSSLQETLYPWLDSQEKLLWAGRPDPLRMARARIGFALAGLTVIILLFLTPLWHVFTPFPQTAEVQPSYSLGDIHIAEAVPFAMFLGGIVLIIQPLTAYWHAGRTAYAVTGQRLLMVRKDMLGILIKTSRYDEIEAPILNLRSGGSGDIFFFQKAGINGSGYRPSPLTRFLGVRDAEQVHRLICGRMPLAGDKQRLADPVDDYLEILVQGKKGFDREDGN